MRKRSFHTSTVLYLSFATVLGASAVACDAAEEPPPAPKKRPKLSELSQAGPDMTEEELAEARKKAGFKSQEEIAAENAAVFEKGAREYVKTRLAEYETFTEDFNAMLGELEKDAPKWKDEAAFEKFRDKYKERVDEFTDTYDTLTGHGVEGGETQAKLGKAFRMWEDLNTGLGAGVGDNPKFKESLDAIRDEIKKVDEALAEIEKDENLAVDETYEPPKKKKKKK